MHAHVVRVRGAGVPFFLFSLWMNEKSHLNLTDDAAVLLWTDGEGNTIMNQWVARNGPVLCGLVCWDDRRQGRGLEALVKALVGSFFACLDDCVSVALQLLVTCCDQRGELSLIHI